MTLQGEIPILFVPFQRLPQDASPFPDVDQMLQDIPLSREQESLKVWVDFASWHFAMVAEISHCMGFPERLLH